MIPARFFRQQHARKKKGLSSSSNDDDDDTDDESTDQSFYHNPYHSSGQMNYVDVPQQQYINEHTYPSYLAQRQTSPPSNVSLDEQIHAKLLSLQQRGSEYPSYVHRTSNYAYRPEILPSVRPTFVADEERELSEPAVDDDDDEAMRAFYPGPFPNRDEQFDLASVVFWYRNVMRSVKKFM